MAKRAVFFAKVHDPDVLARNEFYATDIRILKDLGYEVTIATDPKWVPGADLYFVWWWTWAFFPLLHARARRKPIVIAGVFDHVLADGSLESFPRRPRWHQWMIRQALQHADANVFTSQIEYDHVVKAFAVTRPSFSYCVVDSQFYEPCPGAKEPFFLTVCWLNALNPIRKSVAETIRAVAQVHDRYPDYQLLIVGEQLDGYLPLAKLVEELGAGGYIKFLGVISRERKRELMQRCTAYLQPTRVEGFGLAIAEAMCCGAPVITSPVGSVPEVVGDFATWCDSTRPESIAAGIIDLLEHPEQAQRHAAEGPLRIREMFSYEKRKRDLAQVLGSLP